jgi:hypothetical protein
MERLEEMFWRTAFGTVLLSMVMVVGGNHAAAAAASAASGCADGTYAVKGKPLIGAEFAKGEDAIVLAAPDDAEGTTLAVAVRSGCPESRVTMEPTQGGLRLSADLVGCTGATGTLSLRAKIDASCRTMRGRLTAGAHQASTRRFRAILNGGVTGRVIGRVMARHGDATLFLPRMKVFLAKAGKKRKIEHPVAVADDAGRFSISARHTGEFVVCASGNGLKRSCTSEPVRFGPGEPEVTPKDVMITIGAGAVHGKVLLADGSPCFQPPMAVDAGVFARVSRDGDDAAGVTADSDGEYLLAGIRGPGTHTLRAVCGGAQVEQTVDVGVDALSGARAVDLVLPNASPTIRLLSAWQDGKGIRTAAPGSTVAVRVEADDPDGDPLHFAWVDAGGGVVSADAPEVAWKLQATPGQNLVNVVVTDGKGGYARQHLVVKGGVPFARFTGTVRDAAGAPIADAVVTVGDGLAMTDAGGFFRVKVDPAARHVVTVKARGYAPYSKPYDGDAIGLDVVLRPAKRFTADPSEDITIEEGPNAAVIRIPAKSLVDADGNPARGPVEVQVSTYDPYAEGFPGDGVGEVDGRLEGMQLQTCLWLTVTDANGKRVNLASGARAEVSFKIPDTTLGEAPATLDLVRFDEAKGLWVKDGTAILEEDRYRAPIASLSAAGISLNRGSACIRVQLDDNSLERPFNLKVIDSTDGATATAFVTQTLTPVFGMRPNMLHFLQVTPKNSTHIITTALVKTGNNLSPASQPFPYSACTPVVLKAKLPTNHWLTFMGFGDEQTAQAYYQRIGAIPAKDTFSKWLAANGFEQGFHANDVVFFNPNEIGLGRRVNCRKRTEFSVPVVACYNTKFGEVGGNVDEMLEDTADQIAPGDVVAMEFSFGGLSASRNVKFYIYGPDGKLKTHTAFDTEGSVKFVPNVCLHCHGIGTRQDLDPVTHAKFVALDPQEYRYQTSGPFTLANQQERFRELNEMIAFAVQHTGPPWDLLDAIYPRTASGGFGVHTPGTKAIKQPVPAGWRDAPEIWNEIVKPSCRTCHMNQASPLNFDDHVQDFPFLALGAQYLCTTGQMPNAMQPQLRLFKTVNPHLPDKFNSFINGGECGTGKVNKIPTVSIIVPSDGTHLPFGALNKVHFSAVASDPEGQPTTIVWLDDAGNQIGSGASFDKIFSKSGQQKIRAIAHDPAGNASLAKEVTIFLDNLPPTLQMTSPLASSPFFRFVPVALRATVSDPNKDATCDKVVWTGAGLPLNGVKGCEPFPASFQTLGPQTITATVTDSAGLTATVTRTVNVVESPPDSPPVMVIFTPATDAVLDPFASTELGATIGDPNIDDCIATPDQCVLDAGTLTWSVRFGPNFSIVLPVTPDAQGIFRLEPIKQGINGCGATPVDLVAKLVNTHGSVVNIRRVTLTYPPC